MKLENVIKGWILSLVGLAFIVGVVLDIFNVVHIPAIDNVPKYVELLALFVCGIILFFAPETFEKKIEGLFDKGTDALGNKINKQ